MPKITIPIRGMHCRSCEMLIEKNLKKLRGVKHAEVSHKKGTALIHYEGAPLSHEELAAAIQGAGYEIGAQDRLPWMSADINDYLNLTKATAILFFIYFVARGLGLFELNISTDMSNAGLAIALLVGLIAGVSTCMALIGGLVLGLSARHAELHPEASVLQKFRPHLYFNLGRLVGFALLGGFIGFLGNAFQLSIKTLGVLTVLVGLVMIFLGLKLIEIFPVLRDKTLALPAGIGRFFGFHKEGREYSHRGAMLTGALTFFLPCGFTQAMQLYAVSTGSFARGAIVMGLFALGTAPGLLGLGGLTSVFRGRQARLFFATVGLAILLVGGWNIVNGGYLISAGSQAKPVTSAQDKPSAGEAVQEVRMTQNSRGYSPNVFTVKKEIPVKWIINSVNPYSCASWLIMSQYGINTALKNGENIIEFTPTQTGEIPFSCSMGMYRGKFRVTEDL